MPIDVGTLICEMMHALSLRRLGVLMLLKSRLSLCLIGEEARWELCFFIA
jgi:hypothetical protein